MIKAIDAILRRAVDSGDVPGVVAGVTGPDQMLYEGVFGVRDLSRGDSMTFDTVGLIASMTKAITSVAAMQLVEQGKLDLESPASTWQPDLGRVQVLEGFDEAGQPRLRAPRRAITLRHLLTHTAGFGYEFLDERVARYQQVTDTPGFASSTRESLQTPLLFDPGERWQYGINTDWVGLLIEAASGKRLGEYLVENVLGPLGMSDTVITIRPDQRVRLARIHARESDGSLRPIDLELPQQPPCDMGGQALYGTVGDYLKFVRMVLNRGRAPDGRILAADSLDLMMANQIGTLEVESLRTVNRNYSNDLDLPPNIPHKWGLACMINSKDLPTGRKAGSQTWAGLCNTYFWIDPVTGIGGAYLTQILPFADVKALPLFLEFESATYEGLQ